MFLFLKNTRLEGFVIILRMEHIQYEIFNVKEKEKKSINKNKQSINITQNEKAIIIHVFLGSLLLMQK